MIVTQIERRKIELFVSTDIPLPEYRIGQLVEVFSSVSLDNPSEKRWFPARVTGMEHSYSKWSYQVQFLNCSGQGIEWVNPEDMWLLEP
ncbi:hypothetical protein PL11201_470006 [Planktothrix sp. PCC 11201]|uniref:hypothetical protein n=1 Tax=Planktothrix sp. PCC 11201 TaxID=1729650 RepID=UPI0009155E04|nr:hypothetical protein [Planktothrix sp. PCC 11201]SKB13080.1 hypothetical protein PL11201_470006 [Planktothrix sp. PCC 11201]